MRDFLANLVCNSGSTNNCAQVSSGISDVERNTVAIYPNPTTDILNFSVEETGTFEIIDAIGRTVMSGTAMNGKNRLDVNSLPKGAYTLKLTTETVGTAHFIKE